MYRNPVIAVVSQTPTKAEIKNHVQETTKRVITHCDQKKVDQSSGSASTSSNPANVESRAKLLSDNDDGLSGNTESSGNWKGWEDDDCCRTGSSIAGSVT